LRQELVSLLERALESSRKGYLEHLRNQLSSQANYHYSARLSISNAEQDVTRLLASLSSSNYRNTIAEVVTCDFGQLLTSLHTETNSGNLRLNDLAEPSIDREKMRTVQQLLESLYRWDEKPAIKEQGENSEWRQTMGASRRSNRHPIFESRERPQTERGHR
jgi:hypothetical protein